MISQEELKRRFEYRDGELLYKIQPSNNIKIGSRVGARRPDGYYYCCVNKKREYVHRLIWTILNGPIPNGYGIDHKDRNPSNNYIDNLRLATQQENRMNCGKAKKNKSGFRGVYFLTPNCWAVQIGLNKKKTTIGYAKTPELAHEIHKQAALKLYGEFANSE